MASDKQTIVVSPGDYTPVQRKVVNALWIGAGVLLAGGVTYLVVRKAVRTTGENAVLDKASNVKSPAAFAVQLEQAFLNNSPFGLGTDEVQLRKLLVSIPHREFFEAVEKAYKLAHHRPLVDVMRGELSSYTLEEMLAIIAGKPKDKREADRRPADYYDHDMLGHWATRYRAGSLYEWSFFWPYGTDVDAMQQVLREIPSIKAMIAMNEVYESRYDKTILQELGGEMSGSDLENSLRIIKTKPDAKIYGIN